jgi:hypothetical protein
VPEPQDALLPEIDEAAQRQIYEQYMRLRDGVHRNLSTAFMQYVAVVAETAGTNIDTLLIRPEKILRKLMPFARSAPAPASRSYSVQQALPGNVSIVVVPDILGLQQQPEKKGSGKASAGPARGFGISDATVQKMDNVLFHQSYANWTAFMQAEEALYVALTTEYAGASNPVASSRLLAWESSVLSILATSATTSHLRDATVADFLRDPTVRASFGRLVGLYAAKTFMTTSSGHLQRNPDDIARQYKEAFTVIAACSIKRTADGGRRVLYNDSAKRHLLDLDQVAARTMYMGGSSSSSGPRSDPLPLYQLAKRRGFLLT